MASFFRLTKNKQFNYIPRYYNEQEEEMKKRKERIAREINSENSADKTERIPLMKGQIRNYYYQNTKGIKRKSNLRVLIVLIILLFMAYYLLMR
ncbi:MAG: hypothetical protein GXO79_01310 [Chlorobi bacterium]|nr:hypothetical protein [Chlorobiota bacterium]